MHVAVVGGSDAGIEAARRCRELDPGVEVSLLVADAYPNFSICGIPYHISGDVPEWRDLAHRSRGELEQLGIRLLLDHQVTALDLTDQSLDYTRGDEGNVGRLGYDRLVICTGAEPLRPPIDGLQEAGPSDGVPVLHTMPDTFAFDAAVTEVGHESTAVVVGAGYVGVEMAEALTARGLRVVVVERLPQVLPRTLDPPLAAVVEEHLRTNEVDIRCGTTVRALSRYGSSGILVHLQDAEIKADLVLVAAGVRPSSELAAAAGIDVGVANAVAVDRQMRTSLEGVWAAGDCVHTHHRLMANPTYLPLGTTAHKQGRIAGENALGGSTEYAGSLGTQVVKVFDQVAAATGLRDDEARRAGYSPATVQVDVDDHKRYYPGATTLMIRLTGDRRTGRLLGGQLVGVYGAEVAKRIDVLAAAVHHGDTVAGLAEFDLSYTPPLGSPMGRAAAGRARLAGSNRE